VALILARMSIGCMCFYLSLQSKYMIFYEEIDFE
jgi:hypothetical protein